MTERGEAATPPVGSQGSVAREAAARAGIDPAAFQAAAADRGLGAAIAEQFSWEKAIGGPRGLIESVLPMTLFSVVYGVTRGLVVSLVAAVVPALALAGWRVVAREPLTQALSGLFGIAIGAVLALKTGRAEDVVVPSLIKNSAWAAGYALSIVVRWPLIGVLLGFALGEATHWRQVPARYRVYALASWVWVAMFGIRLAVQFPLWLAHRAAELALINVLLGLPLFGATIWATWALVSRVPVAHPPADPDAEADLDPDAGPGTAPDETGVGAAPIPGTPEPPARKHL